MSEQEICLEVRSSLDNITDDLRKRYERKLAGRESCHDESWLSTDRSMGDRSPREVKSTKNVKNSASSSRSSETNRKRSGNERSPVGREREVAGISKRKKVEPTMGTTSQRISDRSIGEKPSTVTSATCRPRKRDKPLEEVYVVPSTSRRVPREEVVVVATPPQNLEEDAVAMNISASDILPDLQFSLAPEAEETADSNEC